MDMDQDHTGDPNANNMTHDGTPKWIQKLNSKTIQSTTNITKAMAKKRNAIKKLDEHVSNKTCPSSLRVNVRVMVTEPHQGMMDNVVKNAATQFQEAVLRELVNVRKNELKSLEEDRDNVMQEWQREFETTVDQMNAEGLLPEERMVFISRHEKKIQG